MHKYAVIFCKYKVAIYKNLKILYVWNYIELPPFKELDINKIFLMYLKDTAVC